MQRITSLLLLMLFSMSGIAQNQIDPCATDDLGEERQQFLKAFQSDVSSHMTEDIEVLRKIPLYIHIVSKNDGTGGIALEEVMDMICRVNDQYKPVEFEFYLEGLNFINNTNYWSYNNGNVGAQMMNANNEPNVVNIYMVDNPSGACGYFTGHSDAVALNNNCINSTSTTASHEIGHYFALPHTFLGWENNNTPPLYDQEKVDKSNCNTAGDGFCDTPADYVSYRWPCPYNGSTLIDPNGDTVIPDPTYYMSYSQDQCQDKFSPQQINAMKSFLISKRPNLLNPNSPSYKPLSDPNLISPVNSATVPYDYVALEWDAVNNATMYHVQVSRFSSFVLLEDEAIVDNTYYVVGPDLTEGVAYNWRVKPIMPANTCEGYSPAEQFVAGESTGIEDLGDDGWKLDVFPNPVSNDRALEVQVSSTAHTGAQIEVVDINGGTVLSMNRELTTGNNSLKIASNRLANGIYVLRVTAEGKQLTHRFVVLD